MCFRPPAAQKKENKCPQCETVNPPEADVCSNCGAQLLKLPPPPGVSASAAGAPKAPPAAPKAPPAPPKAPPAPPKKPGES